MLAAVMGELRKQLAVLPRQEEAAVGARSLWRGGPHA